MGRKLIDITGNKYGKLTVIEYSGKEKWLCQCECGNKTYATGTGLRSGKRVSCGCETKTRLIDLTGKKIGRLTVLERDRNRTGKGAYWICVCECGNRVSVSGDNLGKYDHSGTVDSRTGDIRNLFSDYRRTGCRHKG